MKELSNQTISGWKSFGINLGLLASGSLLFALAFPSFLADWGFGPLGFIALAPLFLLIKRMKWWASPFWGLAYGYATYSLFNFWLASFNPVSFLIVPIIYAVYFSVFVPVLLTVDRAFPRFGWLAQLAVWGLFEVFRNKFFLGYAYGILGYSQYYFRSFIGISDIFGVLMVSLMTAAPSAIIAHYLFDRVLGREGTLRDRWRPGKRWTLVAGIWGVLFLAANIYGLAARVDYSDSPKWRVGLVQHNVNAWLKGNDAYRDSLDALLEVSEEALSQDPEVLIWSETSFVPAIEWHEKYRRDRGRVELVKRLREFLSQVDIPVIIGNNDSYMDGGEKIDHNAVLLFDREKIVDRYHKIHLVPFSEHFPFAKTFPRLFEYIQAQGTPLYTAGDEFVVFDLSADGGPLASPLICFEDTFGYLARGFVQAGAEVLVNVTNDAWSPQPACSIQHVTMAIFRSVENRRTLVRATTGGITTAIDPNGKPIGIIEPFTRQALVTDVPIYTDRKTLYTRWGDWFETVLLVIAGITIVSAVVVLVRRGIRRRKEESNG